MARWCAPRAKQGSPHRSTPAWSGSCMPSSAARSGSGHTSSPRCVQPSAQRVDTPRPGGYFPPPSEEPRVDSTDSTYLQPYLPILVLLLLAGVMCFAISFLAGYLGPKRIFPIKETAFECGSPTTGDPHSRHSVKFYLVALLFIVFDIESVFIYPWGALLRDFAAQGLGLFAYLEMLSFMATLALGLVYVWRKGALEWS